MPKNKNNSSTKVVNKGKTDTVGHDSSDNCCKNTAIMNKKARIVTRSKRSRSVEHDDRCQDKQPLSKMRKQTWEIVTDYNSSSQNDEIESNTPTTPVKSRKRSLNSNNLERSKRSIKRNEDQNVDDPIIGTAKSLIKSIKSGKLGKSATPEKLGVAGTSGYKGTELDFDLTDSDVRCKIKNKADHKQKKIFTLKMTNNKIINQNLVDNLDKADGDGVEVGVRSSEDDYSEDSESSDDSMNNTEVESRDSESIESGQVSDCSDDEVQFKDASPHEESSDDQEDQALDRNDPRVQKLLKQIEAEEKESRRKKKERKRKERELKRKGSKQTDNHNISKTKNSNDGITLKSPSDTTLYVPALCKDINSPTAIGQKLAKLNVSNTSPITDAQISDFVEKIRREERAAR